MDEQLFGLPTRRSGLELLQRVRICKFELTRRGAPQRLQMSAATHLLPHIVASERTYVPAVTRARN